MYELAWFLCMFVSSIPRSVHYRLMHLRLLSLREYSFRHTFIIFTFKKIDSLQIKNFLDWNGFPTRQLSHERE